MIAGGVRLHRTCAKLEAVALPLLVFFLVFPLVNHTGDATHDYGSQAAIEYWLLTHRVFGSDIVQNVGPYGYLNYPDIYTGFLDAQKLCINIGLTALFAFLFTRSVRGKGGLLRLLLVTLVALLAVNDAFFYLLFLFVAHALLHALPRNLPFSVPALRTWMPLLGLVPVLALLSLGKGTFLVLGSVTLGVLVVGQLLAGRLLYSLLAVILYLVSLQWLWMAAGQPPDGLPDFVEAILGFTAGYNGAMQIFEPPLVTALSLALALVSAWIVLRTAGQSGAAGTPLITRVSFALVQLLLLLVVWKHGMVRADQHVIVFVCYAALACFFGIWSFGSRLELVLGEHAAPEDRRRFGIALGLSVLVVVLAQEDLYCLNRNTPGYLVRSKHGDLLAKINALADPVQYVDGLRGELRATITRIRGSVEPFRALAGDGPVGYLGMFPGNMVYSGLDYRPLPSTVSFTTWNSGTARRDAEFLADSGRAPPFIIVDLRSIDHRFVPQDDAPAKFELLRRYSFVARTGELSLFRRRARPDLQNLQSQAPLPLEAEAWMELPNVQGALWFSVAIPENRASRLVAALYKPPSYVIEYRTNRGEQWTQRLVPAMAAMGMLAKPLLSRSQDLEGTAPAGVAAWLPADDVRRVLSFRVRCDHLDFLCETHYQVQFSSVPPEAAGQMPR